MKEFSRVVRIVLVRPRNPLNLLAAARAAANFGFDGVVAVAPHEPVWKEALAAEQARRWLGNTRRTATLPEAIEDCNWVLGTSSLSRRRIAAGQRVVSLDRLRTEAGKEARRDRIAILFGSEKRGLTKRDLEICHAVIRIPTNETVPSMNLGQAVALCCYELRAWSGRQAATLPLLLQQERPATAGEIGRLLESIGAVLGADAKAASGWGQREVRFRRMLMRMPLNSADVALLLGSLRDLAWRLRARP